METCHRETRLITGKLLNMISRLILVFILWQDVTLANVIFSGAHMKRDVHNGMSVESKVIVSGAHMKRDVHNGISVESKDIPSGAHVKDDVHNGIAVESKVIVSGAHMKRDVHNVISVASKDKLSKCKVETNSSSAYIVCNLSIDVNAVTNDFHVDHFENNWSIERPETVFMIKRTEGKTEYKCRPGYQLQGNASRIVTLKIPKLSEEHAGRYMCTVIPSDMTEVEMCDLPLEVIPTGVHAQRHVPNLTSDEIKVIEVSVPVRMDFDKRISYENTVSPQYSSDEGTESHPSPLVIGVSVVAGFVVFLVIAIA